MGYVMIRQPPLADLIRKYSAPVPRYTSYPTAPHFHGDVGPERYAEWLRAIPESGDVSLYVHIPFCDTLCWFCGCHTKIVRRYEPVLAYLERVREEAALVSAHLPEGARLSHIHWGGGSPTLLEADEIASIAQSCKNILPCTDDAEFAVEIDPRDLDDERIAALAGAGVNRASIGVQDFDPEVQRAINRIQSLELTAACVAKLRGAGIASINMDLLYGLPFQTEESLAETLRHAIAMDPDRIAMFGYAHVPWLKTHQRLIPEDALPSPLARLNQFAMACDMLEAAGYMRVGLDHFAKADDPLAVAAQAGTLNRNFQGYTTDSAASLIGLGASAIGSLNEGYIQNLVPIHDYMRTVKAGELPVARGIALSEDDRIRRHVIERLMSGFVFSRSELERHFGSAARAVISEAARMEDFERDGLIAPTPDGFLVTRTGRFFVRAVAARFDAYLARRTARHSLAV